MGTRSVLRGVCALVCLAACKPSSPPPSPALVQPQPPRVDVPAPPVDVAIVRAPRPAAPDASVARDAASALDATTAPVDASASNAEVYTAAEAVVPYTGPRPTGDTVDALLNSDRRLPRHRVIGPPRAADAGRFISVTLVPDVKIRALAHIFVQVISMNGAAPTLDANIEVGDETVQNPDVTVEEASLMVVKTRERAMMKNGGERDDNAAESPSTWGGPVVRERRVQDLDDDGTLEAMVFWSFGSRQVCAVGSSEISMVSIVNLSPKPTLAVNGYVSIRPEAETLEIVQRHVVFRDDDHDGHRDLLLLGTACELEDPADPDNTRRTCKPQNDTYLWNAQKDTYVLKAKPPTPPTPSTATTRGDASRG